MKTVASICIVLAALSSIVNSQKLQITVEENIEDCQYRAQKGDTLYTYYTGTFENGEVFDSNVGKRPYTFRLGARQVIRGMEQGTLGMCEGEKRELIIPSELAYGENGAGDIIPPNTTLIFQVELVKIMRNDEL
ncbi:Peptidyl-prolyl cis-trans isomerase FKBP2 [Pseudolycoriella hygida]|uniref:peptidylprolyl isomerase n=1 Tax=Pseudolycoriella hygida TaxID=35572 RepID=A0A9Q0S485_9DIPT|nr:Peptidyl-prolyl cis-trans isomerase FKBP2 [Pseudolycoriella hygida]